MLDALLLQTLAALRFRCNAPAAMMRRLRALAGRLQACVTDRIAEKDVAIFVKQVHATLASAQSPMTVLSSHEALPVLLCGIVAFAAA